MNKPALLDTAQRLSNALASHATRKLLYHAVRYLRRVRDVEKFGRFLSSRHASDASRAGWEDVARRLRPLLRTLPLDELAYVLGWAVRLEPQPAGDQRRDSGSG